MTQASAPPPAPAPIERLHEHTHPDRLATIARLHGIAAPNVESCRVLELGCGSGANLAAMAASLGDARFVGADASSHDVERGRAALAAAGVKNVELHVLDVMNVGEKLGTFDYVIAHGLFAWVSTEAQDEIFAICARALSPNGVAYVGYNTHPGWHLLGTVREMIAFELRGVKEPAERLRRAREYVGWLRSALPGGGAYGARFGEELALLAELDDARFADEYLGPFHKPVHFNKLAMRAKRFGLKYLCEAEPTQSADHSPSPEGELARARSPDELVHAEQHYDFLVNRRFRKTLFCRRQAPLTRKIQATAIGEMFVSSRAKPASPDGDPRDAAPMTFDAPLVGMTTDHPATKAALVHLASVAPRAIRFSELLAAVGERLGAPPDTDMLRINLVDAFLSAVGVADLRTSAPRWTASPGETPVASAWARSMAERGTEVANLRHELVRLDEASRRFLRLLDGTRNRAALAPELGPSVTVERALGVLAAGALLVS